ncbi:hypothetical protein Lepto7376_2443 [[Leptolyngbya] sp. PCC 7376]|uniref:hypothetical protein n=1 Tax=[Leptolyngbya] sp. PCC 7376 TaxID=111781 RepID=UPI00029EFE5A|nr:hypothetical protein [[Leptolyngbya] sp. PCC 7376]AFY38722.1 hypothetical protein Lepto7376_2443 [[Leptolyngbya] sp. PCC 7376]
MERGLLWLPLLATFIGLAWAGSAEYKKLEAYKVWADNFEQAKYDLYSVMGYRNGQITWGKATRKGIVETQTVAIAKLSDISLEIDGETIAEVDPENLDALPAKGKAVLSLNYKEEQDSTQIPFTQIDLAAKWVNYLQKFIAFGI